MVTEPPKFDPNYKRWRMQMDAYMRHNEEDRLRRLPELIENWDIITKVAKDMGILDD